MRDNAAGAFPLLRTDAGDTIFAPATGRERSAVAVVRISGAGAHRVLSEITRSPLPPWRELALRKIVSRAGETLDQAMVVVFPAGSSYTGEAMAEVHCHGGPATLTAVLERIGRFEGCRVAAPGEFTFRALMNGRMDLAEVEGLADLIAAETDLQRRQAMRIMSGAVSDAASGWRERLLRARSLVELTIDWADEEVPEDVTAQVQGILSGLIEDLQTELQRAGSAEKMRTGFEVAIVGAPNVGKSSLLNAIAGREAAIVTEIPGTTRDVLEVRFDLDGLPVTFLDTAGVREAENRIEEIGIGRAEQRAAAADLRLLVRSPDVGPSSADMPAGRDTDLRVSAKSDLGSVPGDVAISALNGTGVDVLLGLVRERLSLLGDGNGLLGNVRRRLAVESSSVHLKTGVEHLDRGDLELAAEEMRAASMAIDHLVGRIGVEDVLSEVFGNFCLGK